MTARLRKMTISDDKSYGRGRKKMLVNMIIYAIIAIVALRIAFAIPNTLTLQGKLTNAAGASLSGSYTMVFRIYDIPGFSYYNVSNQTSEDNTAITNITYINYTNILWEDNRTVTTDANGIYDIMLNNLSKLNFSDQYYLGIMVMGDNESVPRINLSSSPYAFRANTSEGLNRKNRYEVSVLNITGNLSLGTDSSSFLSVTTERINISDGNINAAGNFTMGEKITFSLGQIIDNLVNGFLRISGKLNVTGNVSIGGNTLFVDNTSGRVGIGTAAPNEVLEVIGNVRVSGSLNATNINASRFYARNGTISALSYTFIEDANTGVIKTSEDNLTFVTGGVSRLTINGSGSVGIGTTEPRGVLHINAGAGAQLIFEAESNDMQLRSVDDDLSHGGLKYDAYRHVFEISGTERMRIATDGNVGIGTTSPAATLDVKGKANFTGNFSVGQTSNIFFVDNTSGNVGIGTTGPTEKLTVNGNISVGSNYFKTTNFAIKDDAGSQLAIRNAADTDWASLKSGQFITTVGITMLNNGYPFDASNTADGNYNHFRARDSDTDSLVEVARLAGDSDPYFSTGGSQQFKFYNSGKLEFPGGVINASGNIGIGTTSPATVLDVKGKANFTGNFSVGQTGNYLFVDNTSGGVGIGTTAPINLLTIAGDVSAFGSLNATFINATRITGTEMYIGTKPVQASGDFNLGNISNDTLRISNNATMSLWNKSGANIFNREFGGNVGLGAINPAYRLTVENETSAGNVLNVSDVLFVNGTSKRVGIGTTGPSGLLDVRADGNNIRWGASAGAQGELDRATGKAIIRGLSGNTLSLGSNSNYDYLLIDTAGNVGIGTTAPGRKLEVSGSMNATQLNISGNANLAYGSGMVGIGTTTPVNLLTISGDVSAFGSLNATFINATRITGTEMYIGTKPVQASGDFNLGNISNDTLRISNNATMSLWNKSGANIFNREFGGNVGIGTISPLQKLEVAGNILVNNTLNAFVNLSGPILRKSGNDIVISD